MNNFFRFKPTQSLCSSSPPSPSSSSQCSRGKPAGTPWCGCLETNTHFIMIYNISSSPSQSSSSSQPEGIPLFLAGTSRHPPHTRVSGRLEQRLQEPTLSSPSLSSTSLNKDYLRLRCHQIHHLCLFHHHLL